MYSGNQKIAEFVSSSLKNIEKNFTFFLLLNKFKKSAKNILKYKILE